MKKCIITFCLLFLTIFVFSQNNVLYKKKQLGYVSIEDTYVYVDGGTSTYNVVFYTIKYCKLFNTYTIKGRVFDPVYNNEDDKCDPKYFVGMESNILFYKGVNDTINRKVSKIKYFDVDNCGNFSIRIKFKNNERLYFYSIGYSLLEIDFALQRTKDD